MARQTHQYVVDEKGEIIGIIIPLEEYHQLRRKTKMKPARKGVKFGSGHLGDIHGELSREDIYCDR